MIKPQEFKGKVVERFELNEKVYVFHIELLSPHKIEFMAGQYVSVPVLDQDRRSYSIASSPDTDHAVELCVDVSPGGVGSKFFENLKVGDDIELLGPMGDLIVEEDNVEQEKKLAFVATGAGVVPFRSIISDLLKNKKEERKMNLYWGLRFVEDMFWEEEFRQLDQQFSNFDLDIILSKPPLLWPMESGYVTGMITDRKAINKQTGLYLCGNPDMIKDMEKIGEKQGLKKEQIHKERFF